MTENTRGCEFVVRVSPEDFDSWVRGKLAWRKERAIMLSDFRAPEPREPLPRPSIRVWDYTADPSEMVGGGRRQPDYEFVLRPIGDSRLEVWGSFYGTQDTFAPYAELAREAVQTFDGAMVCPPSWNVESESEPAKRGRPRLEDSRDWAHSLELVAKWERYTNNRKSPDVAADLVGVPLSTLRNWAKRRDELARDNAGKE